MFSVALVQVGNVNGALMMRHDKQKRNFQFSVIVAAVNVGLDFYLIPRFHALGATTANVTAQMLAVTIVFAYITTVLGYKFPWRCFFNVTAQAAVFVLTYLCIRRFVPFEESTSMFLAWHFLYVICCCVCSMFVFRVTRVFDSTDVAVLRRLAGRLPHAVEPAANKVISFLAPSTLPA